MQELATMYIAHVIAWSFFMSDFQGMDWLSVVSMYFSLSRKCISIEGTSHLDILDTL